jgi:hypothetical protein
MALGLAVGDDTWSVGSPDLLHAFFSTVSVRLEPGGWGTRFPALLNELYDGALPVTSVETALSELLLARRELGLLPASHVVWDADARHVPAPRSGSHVAGAPSLARSFVTDEGRDLFDVLLTALVRLRTQPAGALRIVSRVPA